MVTNIFRSFTTAIRTLTILPVPGRDAENFSSSLYWFPAIGLLLGAILYGVMAAIRCLTPALWPEGTAVITLVISILLTRGLHLDGLSDFADGFWGSPDREKVLKIMKDPSIGSFGGIALIVIILAKWVFLTRLAGSSTSASCIIVAYVISRTMQAVMAASFPYARANGGTGEAFVKNASPRHAVSTLITALLLILTVSRYKLFSVTLLTAAWIATILLGKWSNKRIGGITGDVLGACSEIIETSTLGICAFSA